MADGKLCCSGSSLFLKSRWVWSHDLVLGCVTGSMCRYGVGYHMTVVKEPGCVSENVERLVCSFVPEAHQETDVGAELSFTLPSNATGKFPELFDKLDSTWLSSAVVILQRRPTHDLHTNFPPISEQITFWPFD